MAAPEGNTQLCFTTNQQDLAQTFLKNIYTYMRSCGVEKKQMLEKIHPLVDKLLRGNIPSVEKEPGVRAPNRKHMELPLY